MTPATNVSNDMTITPEEIFGPVLCIVTYRDEDEAVAIAQPIPRVSRRQARRL